MINEVENAATVVENQRAASQGGHLWLCWGVGGVTVEHDGKRVDRTLVHCERMGARGATAPADGRTDDLIQDA